MRDGNGGRVPAGENGIDSPASEERTPPVTPAGSPLPLTPIAHWGERLLNLEAELRRMEDDLISRGEELARARAEVSMVRDELKSALTDAQKARKAETRLAAEVAALSRDKETMAREIQAIDRQLERSLAAPHLRNSTGATRGGRFSLLRRLARRTQGRALDAYRRDDFEGASRLFAKAVKRCPDDLISLLYLARAQRAAGDLTQSLATISAALEVEPNWAPAVWHATDLRERLNYREAARARVRAFVPRANEDPRQVIRLLRLSGRLDEPETVQRIADHLEASYPDHPECVSAIQEVRDQTGFGIAQ
jgi:tetratricopeptide (TPR) repeat protein